MSVVSCYTFPRHEFTLSCFSRGHLHTKLTIRPSLRCIHRRARYMLHSYMLHPHPHPRCSMKHAASSSSPSKMWQWKMHPWILSAFLKLFFSFLLSQSLSFPPFYFYPLNSVGSLHYQHWIMHVYMTNMTSCEWLMGLECERTKYPEVKMSKASKNRTHKSSKSSQLLLPSADIQCKIIFIDPHLKYNVDVQWINLNFGSRVTPSPALFFFLFFFVPPSPSILSLSLSLSFTFSFSVFYFLSYFASLFSRSSCDALHNNQFYSQGKTKAAVNLALASFPSSLLPLSKGKKSKNRKWIHTHTVERSGGLFSTRARDLTSQANYSLATWTFFAFDTRSTSRGDGQDGSFYSSCHMTHQPLVSLFHFSHSHRYILSLVLSLLFIFMLVRVTVSLCVRVSVSLSLCVLFRWSAREEKLSLRFKVTISLELLWSEGKKRVKSVYSAQ